MGHLCRSKDSVHVSIYRGTRRDQKGLGAPIGSSFALLCPKDTEDVVVTLGNVIASE